MTDFQLASGASCYPSLRGHVSRRGSLVVNWNSNDESLNDDGQVLICTQTYLSHYMTLPSLIQR